jgi:hypothetical protein
MQCVPCYSRFFTIGYRFCDTKALCVLCLFCFCKAIFVHSSCSLCSCIFTPPFIIDAHEINCDVNTRLNAQQSVALEVSDTTILHKEPKACPTKKPLHVAIQRFITKKKRLCYRCLRTRKLHVTFLGE